MPTNAVGAFMYGNKLRECNLSDLEWGYDAQVQEWIVHHAETGSILAYITREMVEMSAFTPLSTLSVWIEDVCRRCIDGPVDSVQNFVARDEK